LSLIITITIAIIMIVINGADRSTYSAHHHLYWQYQLHHLCSL